MNNKEAYERLKALKGRIKPNTYRTIYGQIRAGYPDRALVGIEKIERKLKDEKERCVQGL